ncbi:MAG TPA: iron-sulfur cluster repair di-iron protein [Vicinamibacterales bacterium]|nr:iron-sulfur cluster repair di-iron protein [Vicinamibacterales bacterium]
MTITETTTVAEIATAVPPSVRVFQRYDIDFCCGGKRTIGEVCRARGLSVAALAHEIEAAAATRTAADRDWTAEPLRAVIDHIITAYHDSLRQELPRLQAMATKVESVHGRQEPALACIAAIVAELAADLNAHMSKEERVLFPAIAAREAGAVDAIPLDAPISVMEHEHERAGALLAELRERTDGYEPPEWGCATLRALYQGLAELDAAMQVHVHLENNVLFPRALRANEVRAGG